MIPNDITRGVDGADNLRISVEVINAQNDADQGEPRTMVVGWRKARSSLSTLHQRELFDAVLRWFIAVDLRYLPVERLLITLRLDLPDVVRILVEVRREGDDVCEYLGKCRLEEDDINGGKFYLTTSGSLNDFEEYYKDHLHDKGEQP